MRRSWSWIDNEKKLQAAARDIRNFHTISIDTEYDSFRYFREKLCLIQVKAKKTYLFDPFNKLDFSFLGDVFADPLYLKILHAGDNDVRILKRDYGFVFRNLFDTNRAASLLGCQYLALDTIINQYMGIMFEKSKKMQRSRWDNRPLTDEQITYAVGDTAHLAPLCRVLAKELQRNHLEERARQVFDGIAEVIWQERVFDERAYRRVAEYEMLSPNQKKHLKDLFAWRFKKAKELDRAVFMVFSDQEMVKLAKVANKSLEKLINEGVLSREKAKLYGTDLAVILGACRK